METILEIEDLATLKSFILFHILSGEINFSYPEFKNAFWSFKHLHLGGPKEPRILSEECMVLSQNHLGRSVAKEMTKTLFKSFPRKNFINMVKKIKATFIIEISHSHWLSNKGRLKAINKVKALDLALLYPDREKDWRLPPFVNLSEKEFLLNIYKLNRSYYERTYLELKNERNLKFGPLTHWILMPIFIAPKIDFIFLLLLR